MNPNPDKPQVLDPRVRAIADTLQQNPRLYRGYGWLWWTVKAALKAQLTQEQLYLLGNSNDPAMVRLAAQTFGSASAALDAALDHNEMRVMMGIGYAFDDHLPDGAAYRLMDDDVGYANL